MRLAGVVTAKLRAKKKGQPKLALFVPELAGLLLRLFLRGFGRSGSRGSGGGSSRGGIGRGGSRSSSGGGDRSRGRSGGFFLLATSGDGQGHEGGDEQRLFHLIPLIDKRRWRLYDFIVFGRETPTSAAF